MLNLLKAIVLNRKILYPAKKDIDGFARDVILKRGHKNIVSCDANVNWKKN